MILTADKDGAHLVVLDQGELLVESLTKLVATHSIQGGFISGIGALKDVELGYYDLHHKTYLRQKFEHEDFELIALNGNISLKQNVPFIHVHALLGNRDFSVFGGHLFEGTVAVTVEIMILPLGKMPKRAFNDRIELDSICGF